MKMSIFKFLIISISILCLIVDNVFAVGLSYGNTVINFKPNTEIVIPFTLRDIKNGTTVKLSASGELKDYVNLSDIDSNGEFNATIYLPDKIETPGIHSVLIRAQEIPNSTQGAIATVTAAQVPILVKVPYPGKHLEIKLDVSNVKIGESVNFLLTVTNDGEENVSARSMIEIYNADNEKIDTVYAEEKAVEITKIEKFYIEWKTGNIKNGKYKAIAVVTYDGNSTKAEKDFDINSEEKNENLSSITGEPIVSAPSFTPNYYLIVAAFIIISAIYLYKKRKRNLNVIASSGLAKSEEAATVTPTETEKKSS